MSDIDYTRRLPRTQTWWKRAIGVQRPYRRNIRSAVEGRVLDVGCGVGRNLLHLGDEGVEVDTNHHSVDLARSRGLVAYVFKHNETVGLLRSTPSTTTDHP